MEKIIIKVPGQYRYMGEWNEFIDYRKGAG